MVNGYITTKPFYHGYDPIAIKKEYDMINQLQKGELSVLTMTDLYDTAFDPRIPIVDNLLYTGTYIFAGPPKVGKSFLMAQLGYHVAKGIPLWDNAVHQSTVLYLALEDTYARLQSRLSCMFGVEGTDQLYLTTRAECLGSGLSDQLEIFMKKHPDTRLIIIDTLQKIRGLGTDMYSYGSDYENVTKLKAFADKHNLCILLVHHTRKADAKDSFEMISGTTGLLGAADGAFVLQKNKRTGLNAVLDVTGRDQQDMRCKMAFDPERHVWDLIEMETELWKEPSDPLLEAINSLLIGDNIEWQGTATDLLEQISDKPGIVDLGLKPNTLTRKLNVANGDLLNQYGIKYNAKHLRERVIYFKKI